ncbi:MFS general substrate transporter [Mycena indigotica]|uniref:MFS general substrate transporter n=1 Tax=Mycena indigotica TaxID=2126181 RepID=A0A8H6S2F9_9AGAR|nr:MFS general substrate transporter [Mycena indigotica]KAF7290622.1 MFS general substrate transporter [Mycena indigotica]
MIVICHLGFDGRPSKRARCYLREACSALFLAASGHSGCDLFHERRRRRARASAPSSPSSLASAVARRPAGCAVPRGGVLKGLVCGWHYDSDAIDTPGPESCAVPEVEARFARFLSLVAVLDGLGGLAGTALLTLLAASRGRRPALAFVVLSGLLTDALALVTLRTRTLPATLAWLCVATLSQPTHAAFAATLVLVDVVDAETRTAALSALAGWGALAGVLAFPAGGALTTHVAAGRPGAVYVVAAGLWVSAAAYVWARVPETRRGPGGEQEQRRGVMERVRAMGGLLGRRSRVGWLAAHALLAGTGLGYALPAALTLLTARDGYAPADTGRVLGVLGGVQALVLAVGVPWLSGRLGGSEVALALGSYAVECAAWLGFAAARGRAGQMGAIVVAGLGAGHGPTVRSIVAASVAPAQQGEALGVFESAWSLGLLLAPLVMGTILARTIGTRPGTVFYVQAAVVAVAGAVLLVGTRTRRRAQVELQEDSADE